MKSMLCLLLCLSILLCVGCQRTEEPEAPAETEFQSAMPASSFYVLNDTDVYNTFVGIEITPQEHTAPVTSFTTKIYNDTDYILQFNIYLDPYKWEKWKDGQWGNIYSDQTQESESSIDIGLQDIFVGPYYLMPHSAYTRTEDFARHPLEAGLYRLRIEYKLTNETKRFADGFHRTPGVLCVAEGYLVVEAASED